MKKVSYIISMLTLTILSLNAQDCIDYTVDNDHINYPGIFGPETVLLDYDGSAQSIDLGIYGDFNSWNISPYTSAMFGTTISVNGGSPVPLYSIMATGDYVMTDVIISLETTSLNDEYLPDATVSSTSGRIIITGYIESVSVGLTNSGLFYSCSESNNLVGDCEDLTLSNGTPDFPGIFGGGDAISVFDGSNQSVDLGVYGYFNGWSAGGQQDQTLFSVNGSDPVSLLTLSLNVNYTIDGVVINLDTAAVDEIFLEESTSDWTSGVLNFSGPVESIVMTQFESGLLFRCTSALMNDYTTCEDFTVDSSDPNAPGIYSFGDYTLTYDGTNQQIDLGIYGLFNYWADGTDLGQASATFFTINDGDPISLETIFNNVPYTVNGVNIDLNTDFLGGEFPIYGTFTSGIITFSGLVDSIVMTQFESGLLFSCSESILMLDCIDYTEEFGTEVFPGIYGEEDYTEEYDGTYQEISLGVYGLFDWSDVTTGFDQLEETYFSVNGGESVSLEEIYLNQPYVLNDVEIIVDTTELTDDVFPSGSMSSGTVIFTGGVSEITMTQMESGLLFSCINSFDFIEGCDYQFVGDDLSIEGYIVTNSYQFVFSGENQQVSIGYFDWISWEEQGVEWPGDATYFAVNGSEMFALDSIYNNQPFMIGDVAVTVDTTAIPDEYNVPDGMTSGTIIFVGEIDLIETQQVESGIKFICVEEVIEDQEDCIDYTEDNGDPNAPGIYLVAGDYTLNYDSTNQEVSLGIYGSFDWLNIGSGQADQTLFSVNGSESVSLEEIYMNLPFVLNDIEITVDTMALNYDYPLADYWASGTLVFSGHIAEIVMTQFESGLLFSCTNSSDEECDCEECSCQIDADFNYVNINNYFSFVSSGTGTEYSWDFGDGNVSDEENPTHLYTTPGGYEVCLTNYNLADTCTITVCKSIVFMANTPEANIITPNNDGYDDAVKLICNNVTVYDRNGIIVAELTGQEEWSGTDENGNGLPMGEYILKCNETDVIRKITVIR